MNNKYIFIATGFIVGAVFYWAFQQSQIKGGTQEPGANQKADPMNATFSIEGLPVTLKDGESSVKMVADSAAMTVTKYFGAETRADFNGDGREDATFVISQNNGGSGTFYYLVALLSSEGDYKGTEGIFLGDRIAPQATEYLNGEIVVNYLDRKTGEPMSTAPSVATSKYFKVKDNKLTETTRQMSETDARIIAEAACIKGGEALGAGVYNAGTKTWWFDANLNATRLGCNPACVVSAETKTAEINWRCTGAVPPEGNNGTNSGTPCTMEAKICPDGTAVGRTGPNCEFAACPETNTGTIDCLPDDRNADVCIQTYDPVCAPVQVQCIKAPCNPVNQTFSNSCEACKNPLVKSYSKGECPK